MDINTNISFTDDEKKVISIINEVVATYTPTTKAFLVGGFVRDKLLNTPSNDIDVMLSNISGEDFAKLITKHLNIKDAHTIKANPEKSKNITTAKAYIPIGNGRTQEVDFAQARSEVYKDNSRIPEVKPATPQEDAHRRDLTINSIFYSLSENKIVDYTGKGIQDLITGTIRTPEEPSKTFSDDPLRILRVGRFAAKYNWKIDPETYKAMTNPELRNELKQKVSKERLGAEIIKMLKNPNAQYALEILKDTGIFEDIINEAVKGTPYEGRLGQLDMSQNNQNHKLTVWGHTLEAVKNIIEQYKDAEPEVRVVMILSALMHDLGKLDKSIWGESKSHPGSTSYHGHEDESSKISELILKFLKIEPYIQQVSGLAKQHMRPHQLADESNASTLRRFIRKMGEMSLNWLDVFNLALADANAKDKTKDPSISQKYKDLESRLQEAVNSFIPTKDKNTAAPILNGNEIMKSLGIKPGAWMAELTEFVAELQDENPNITKEEAIQKLKDKYQNNLPKPQPKKNTTTNIASNKTESNMSVDCPMHLFKAKKDNISKLISNNNLYEAMTTIKAINDEYGNDEKVNRLVASSAFTILCKDPTLKDNNILEHLFKKAEDNFFDSTLCTLVLGILLLLKTPTKEEVIIEMADRVKHLDPEFFSKIISLLPKNIANKNIKDKILGKSNEKKE